MSAGVRFPAPAGARMPVGGLVGAAPGGALPRLAFGAPAGTPAARRAGSGWPQQPWRAVGGGGAGRPGRGATRRAGDAEELAARLRGETKERGGLGPVLSLTGTAAAVAARRWPRIVVVAITLVAVTALAIAVPALNSLVIDTLIGARPPEMFPRYLAAMVAVYVLEPLLTFVYVRTLWSLGEEVVENLRRDLFRALLVQRVEFFDRHRAAELGALLSVELGSVRTLMTQSVSRDRGPRAVCETLGTCAVLFVMAPALAPMLDAAVVAFAAAAAVYTRAAGPLFGRDAAAQGALSAGTATTLGAMRTVRIFGGEAVAFARFEADASRAWKDGLAVGKARALLECANRSCVYASLFTLFGIGGWLVQAGRVPVGVLVAGVGYCFGLIFATSGVVNTIIDARAASAALGRARRLVTSTSPESALAALMPTAVAKPVDGDAAAEVLAGGTPGMAARAARARKAAESGDIVFDRVRFSYPSRPSAEVLREVSFTLPQGCVTALVGASGAGKTTVTQLLCRFYDPDAGTISVGGRDVSSFLRVDWRTAVALVGQDPVLFAGSVADNIRYGRAGGAASLLEGGGADWAGVATDAEVEAAARAANAHDFITALPEGYNTDVGELGGRLSGGQRQRIAIARAVLKDAPVLILDEATSALDATSESLVQAALRRLMRGRTTLVIAHRLATVRQAEQIIVMGDGRVLEAGRHDDLAARPDGVFHGLLASQRLSFVETLA